jgi:hypothetical protein
MNMKTSAKDAKLGGLILLFLACAILGFEIASQIWGSGTFNPIEIVAGIVCLLSAILVLRFAKKKKKEENQS